MNRTPLSWCVKLTVIDRDGGACRGCGKSLYVDRPGRPLYGVRTWNGEESKRNWDGPKYAYEKYEPQYTSVSIKINTGEHIPMNGAFPLYRNSEVIRDPISITTRIARREADAPHFHHVIPVHLGGSDFPDNIVLLCANCHSLHHTKVGVGEGKRRWVKLRDVSHWLNEEVDVRRDERIDANNWTMDAA